MTCANPSHWGEQQAFRLRNGRKLILKKKELDEFVFSCVGIWSPRFCS